MRGIAGMGAGENPLPQKHREHTTALQAGAQRQMRGTAGVQSRPGDRPGRPRNPQYAVP